MPFPTTSRLLLGAHFHMNTNCQKDIVHAQNCQGLNRIPYQGYILSMN
jgi:hypothetical protein